jgi:hypothetical protein
MRRAAFALLSFCLLVSLALFGVSAAQAGGYGYGGGVVVGGYAGGGYVGGGYVGGGYYGPGPGWDRPGCGRRVRRGLFTGCGYYPRPRVRYYVAPPPPPPVYYHAPRRRCPLVPRLDGYGGWIWAPNAACD